MEDDLEGRIILVILSTITVTLKRACFDAKWREIINRLGEMIITIGSMECPTSMENKR